jgi:hypothetical protein
MCSATSVSGIQIFVLFASLKTANVSKRFLGPQGLPEMASATIIIEHFLPLVP